MRALQVGLLAAILAALCVIGIELYRLERDFAAVFAEAPAETRAQRTERVRRESRELQQDLKAILTDPKHR